MSRLDVKGVLALAAALRLPLQGTGQSALRQLLQSLNVGLTVHKPVMCMIMCRRLTWAHKTQATTCNALFVCLLALGNLLKAIGANDRLLTSRGADVNVILLIQSDRSAANISPSHKGRLLRPWGECWGVDHPIAPH